MYLPNKKIMEKFLTHNLILSIILLTGIPMISLAQNNSSPYSVLGIGDIENSYFNRYTGMANSGVALSDARYINNSNSASLTAMIPRFFSFELSERYKQVIYTGAGVEAPNNKTSDFQMRRLNIATKITDRWGSSIGLMPFSTSSYNFTSYKVIQGTSQSLPTTYQGQGGINQVYWANGYRITKNTSIGVNSSYLFGSLNQTENLQSAGTAGTLITTKNNFLYNYYFNFSLLTKLKLNKHWLSTYGITFTPQTNLNSKYTVNLTDSSTGAVIKAGDPVYGNFTLPMSINAGIALIKDNKYTFTVNAQSQSWGKLNYSGQNYQLVNSNRISLGFQSANLLKNYYNQDYERGFFQLGLYAGNSYLKVNNQQLTDFGASIGYGRNSFRSALGWVAALEFGRQGSTNKNVLSQNYVNLTLTLSYFDFFTTNKNF
jgi:hypothetical protein